MTLSSLVRSLALAVFPLTFASSAFAQERPSPKLTFEDLARAFVDAHCKKDAPVGECPWEDVLAKHYARFELGLFTVQYPTEFLADKPKVETLRDVLLGLLDAQAKWIDWLEPAPPEGDTLRKDLAAVRAWVKGWKPTALAAFAKSDDKDWVATLKPDAALAGAVDRVRKAVHSAERFALVPSDGKGARVVLCPNRSNFMQLLGYGGWVDANAKATNWFASSADWTQFWIDRTVCVALEYTPWEGADPEFRTGLPMNKLSPNGTVQHAVHQSMLALLRQCTPTVAESTLDRGLAAAMTITICGEFTTIDNAGSVYTSGGRTNPYERFVPGGNSAGGTLPPIKADSQNAIVENHWRKGKGKDYFVATLREGQKAGAKEAKSKDPLPHFLLLGGSAGGKHLVHAPFLGVHANSQEYPPAAFVIDYAEFFRSYRAAFVHWLAEKSDATPAAAHEKFAKLVRALGKCSAEFTYEQAIEEAYGLPLSAKDGSTDSLEWRFLKWIQSGK
ncbi:MAG: hypothetical protein L6Q99_04945 [Planctomycetes bacterium]|nr:hypothetical protein [Planctomycetota bacterium]